MNEVYILSAIGVMASVTAAIRFVPFVIFSEKRPTPGFLSRLSKALPAAVMGMLVVYCLRNTEFSVYPGGTAEIIASAVTVITHLIKKNTLLSIAAGTAVYMALVQLVF